MTVYTTTPDKLGVELSRLGFGAMRLPTREDGSIKVEESEALLDYAYHHGVNYFDTAYNYLEGNSQVVLCQILSKFPRDSYYLANKLPMWLCHSREDCEKYFQEELDKCGVDYFDFYLCHSFDRDRWKRMREIGCIELLQEYKRQGKIRFLGFSFHGDQETFFDIVDTYDWDFVQIQINYVDDLAIGAGKLYQKLMDKGLPCMVMEPVRGGYLAQLSPQSRAFLDQCDGGKNSSASWALRWCMSHPGMSVILSGMSTMEQVVENVELFSSGQPLSPTELEALNKTRDNILKAKTIPCTGCDYCSECPQGIAISEVFEIYNHRELFGNTFRSKVNYIGLGREKTFPSCIGCGVCTHLCPQGIQIPQELERVHGIIRDTQANLPRDLVWFD